MATSNYIQNKVIQEMSEYGRGLLSVKYPNDIEVYLMALELVDSVGKTEQYFVFPIMPFHMQKVENNRTNIKKSSFGTTVLMSQSFTPSEISIKGEFGRSFKVLTNPTGNDFALGIFQSRSKDSLQISVPTLDASVKSGYGCTKILQNMVKMSGKLDSKSKPYRLYFYNMALGESYLVAALPGALTLFQSQEKNMIWNYNLTLQILANVEDLKSSEDKKKSLSYILSSKSIQDGVNILSREVVSIL